MTSLQDAKIIIIDGLTGMGYHPVNLVMTEVIENSKQCNMNHGIPVLIFIYIL